MAAFGSKALCSLRSNVHKIRPIINAPADNQQSRIYHRLGALCFAHVVICLDRFHGLLRVFCGEDCESTGGKTLMSAAASYALDSTVLLPPAPVLSLVRAESHSCWYPSSDKP